MRIQPSATSVPGRTWQEQVHTADTWRYAPTVGDLAQVVFTGRMFKLSYVSGPILGTLDVYVDGVKITSIDQHSANWSWEKTWTSDLLAVGGDHILHLVYGSGGSMVSLDAIEVIATQVLSTGIYDDADTGINYIGNWQTLTGKVPISALGAILLPSVILLRLPLAVNSSD